MPRILGIDYGTRRIGLALSDPSGTVATPWQVLDAREEVDAVRSILDGCAAQGVERIVVGLPMRMDGSDGPAAQSAKAFGEHVRSATDIPVVYWDERWSTVTAEQALIEGGARRGKRRQVIDKLAAQIMLQHYLDAQSGLPPMPDGLIE